MNRRAWLWVAASTGVGFCLIAALMATVRADLTTIEDAISQMQPQLFGLLVVLLAINTLISAEKWRLTDRRFSKVVHNPTPGPFYFALTAIGVAFGQIMPTQVSMAVSRSLGLYFFGERGVARGATATIFEQAFDLLVAVFLTLALGSFALTGGGCLTWALWACASSVLGLVFAGAGIEAVAGGLRRLQTAERYASATRAKRIIEAFLSSTLFAPELARRLFILSILRFVVVTLMAGVTTAIGQLDIPLWQISAVIPLIILTSVIPIAPAGLGVNEWAFVMVMTAFRTPADIAAQWVVLNRVLAIMAGVQVGVTGIVVGMAARAARGSSPSV